MSTGPGWFPDPDGTPGRLRWWDGAHWTPQTRPAGSVAPAGRAPTRRTALVVGVVVLALALLGGGIWLVHRSRTDGREITAPPPTPTVRGGDDGSSTPSPSASPSASASARPAGCDQRVPDQLGDPPRDGRVHGGPLSYPTSALPGWTGPISEPRIPYGRDAHQLYQVVTTETRGWASSVTVGVTTFDPYPGSAAAARSMLQCVVTSDLYQSLSVTVTSARTSTVRVDGVPATRLDAVISFDDPSLHTKGSRLWLLVVDTRPATFVFAAIPKESTDLVAPVDRAIAGLTID